jgi:hypothetical protein
MWCSPVDLQVSLPGLGFVVRAKRKQVIAQEHEALPWVAIEHEYNVLPVSPQHHH